MPSPPGPTARRAPLLLAALAALAGALAHADPTASSGGSGRLFVVAHQDDDLLFANPAVSQGIRAGLPTRTVFLTAAGGPDTRAWRWRESQVFAAQDAMMGRAPEPGQPATSSWRCTLRAYAGKHVRLCASRTRPDVTVVFLRLPDGGLARLWARKPAPPFEEVSPVARLAAYDGSASYTRDELVATLGAILAEFEPGLVGTQDSTNAYGGDHSDHTAGALFALEAERAFAPAHAVRIYRGYNIEGRNYLEEPAAERPNLSPAQSAEKARIMAVYSGAFAPGSDFDLWSARHYAVTRVAGGHGRIAGHRGCLAAGGERGEVVIAPCHGPAAQAWTVALDHTVAVAGGRCLTLADDGETVILAACAGTPGQRWTHFSNGQLRGPEGACLTGSKPGRRVTAGPCRPDEGAAHWRPHASQRFVQQLGDCGVRGDLAGTVTPAAGAALAPGDVDGDGFADACARRADGLWCALNDGRGASGPPSLWSAAFADAEGWGAASAGATVQLGDVDGDGKADLCGRNPSGIVCAVSNGREFVDLHPWSLRTDFSDAEGWGSSPARWGSIRLGDVNGDRLADVCGRSSSGIVCAASHGNGFDAAQQVADTRATGGACLSGTHGPSLLVGDVTGDGRADLCAPGPAGLACASAP